MRQRESLDKLVRDYADSGPSDTFVSYNDAIVLARAVRRLKKELKNVKSKHKLLRLKHTRKNCPYLHVKKCPGCGRSCSCYTKVAP